MSATECDRNATDLIFLAPLNTGDNRLEAITLRREVTTKTVQPTLAAAVDSIFGPQEGTRLLSVFLFLYAISAHCSGPGQLVDRAKPPS